jgi:hypothetical protein
VARDLAFEAPEVLEVQDDPLADRALHGSRQQEAAGRDVHGLAGVFFVARQHVAPEQREGNAAVPAALRRAGRWAKGCS